jgi:hypothetical protein
VEGRRAAGEETHVFFFCSRFCFRSSEYLTLESNHMMLCDKFVLVNGMAQRAFSVLKLNSSWCVEREINQSKRISSIDDVLSDSHL